MSKSDDLISRSAAIEALEQYPFEKVVNCLSILEELPYAQPEKLYTKADYIMALHKEYGCSLTKAEEAHNKALEYLQEEMTMKG